MNFQRQFSCTMMAPNSADPFPTMNRQHVLSCTIVNKESGDFLKDHADNIWFVLGAYFFAFFPWAIMNNIDFISEKWRTCRRTRTLARRHLVGSIFPIIYVAVYAEAQRRAEENTEFGAALAALMFNVYQVLRTIMGLWQLNAFVAWCKDGMECMRALTRKDERDGGNDRDSRDEISEQGVGAEEQSSERRRGQETRKFCGVFELELVRRWCKRGMRRIRDCMSGNTENSEHESTTDEEDVESSLDTYIMFMYSEPGEDIEEEIKVNNMVVDNELGGREVTVLPAWKKMMGGMRKGRFEASRWLRTDLVMLNTVRWCGAFLCGMGEPWRVCNFPYIEEGEMMEKFFSFDMYGTRGILQWVEWNIDKGNGGSELVSIARLAEVEPRELTGEMSTAYGTGSSYYFGAAWTVESYSFEFDSLVSSYPANEDKIRGGNREIVKVGLAHSLVLAKHLGVEKLKAIRQYYEHYGVPLGSIRESAFRLLHKQASGRVPDDSNMWGMFEGTVWKIPLFPYRMQAVALWEEATNWRVLQASAHQDIWNSLEFGNPVKMNDDEEPLHNAVHEVNIFEYCADWSKQHVTEKGMLGVVIETVRTFLAEWISRSEGKPNWEPEVPKSSFEFDRIETIPDKSADIEKIDIEQNIIWVCQRELQRKLAKIGNERENLPGNAELIMLFLLGFPLLRMEEIQDAEFGWEEKQEVPEGSTESCSKSENSVDVFVRLWRVWTVLAPQNISLMIRVDFANRTAALKLRNDSGDVRFKWQDWVDSAMGCLKGIEGKDEGDFGYGRTILKADLREPMMELSPLRVNEDGIEAEVEKTSTAKIWMGWPPFNVGICKFELDQWFTACNANLNGALERRERLTAEEEVPRFEGVIKGVLREENAEVELSTEGDED